MSPYDHNTSSYTWLTKSHYRLSFLPKTEGAPSHSQKDKGFHTVTDRHKGLLTALFFAKQSLQNASSTSDSHPPAPFMRAELRDTETTWTLCPKDRFFSLLFSHSCKAVCLLQ